MEDVILIVVLILIVTLAGVYIYRSKKNGRKCIGCPASEGCQGNCCECSAVKESDKG